MTLPRPGFAALLLLSVLAWLAAVPAARAQCNCEGGDGVFTTHSGIVINGAVADWAAVLADPDNNSCDGANGTAPPQPDRDAPVQSTGRDLTHFAYTWDNTNVQTLTGRFASATNTQRFIYYADTNNDGTMDTGERVIVAAWQGSNRSVSLFLGNYVQVRAGGDPMVDALGFADGYDLPGSVINLPPSGQPHYTGTWGSADGLWMEWGVPWADAPGAPGLGIPSGSAFTFHVSSTNSNPAAGSFPAQVDDNMGGCGGGPASTQFAGVLFTPDRSASATPGATVYLAHTVQNTGNGPDRFDLVAGTPTGGHSPAVAFFHDVDASGTYTAGDSLLTNTGGSPAVDTGVLAAGAVRNILIRYVVSGGASGTAVVVSTATSVYDGSKADTVSDSITVVAPRVQVTKVSSTIADPVHGEAAGAKAIPGARVEYTILVQNSGTAAADAGSVTLTDAAPAGTRLYVGDLGSPAGTGPVRFQNGSPVSGLTYAFISLTSLLDGLEFSDDGGANWNYAPTPGGDGCDPRVTHLRVKFGGALNAPSGGGNPGCSIRFRVTVE